MKCRDCDAEIQIPKDSEQGDIITCACCGLEYEVKIVDGAVELLELLLDGEDFGE